MNGVELFEAGLVPDVRALLVHSYLDAVSAYNLSRTCSQLRSLFDPIVLPISNRQFLFISCSFPTSNVLDWFLEQRDDLVIDGKLILEGIARTGNQTLFEKLTSYQQDVPPPEAANGKPTRSSQCRKLVLKELTFDAYSHDHLYRSYAGFALMECKLEFAKYLRSFCREYIYSKDHLKLALMMKKLNKEVLKWAFEVATPRQNWFPIEYMGYDLFFLNLCFCTIITRSNHREIVDEDKEVEESMAIMKYFLEELLWGNLPGSKPNRRSDHLSAIVPIAAEHNVKFLEKFFFHYDPKDPLNNVSGAFSVAFDAAIRSANTEAVRIIGAYVPALFEDRNVSRALRECVKDWANDLSISKTYSPSDKQTEPVVTPEKIEGLIGFLEEKGVYAHPASTMYLHLHPH